MARGVFVTFEGCDGSGKTTQADKLAEKLRTMNIRILRTREPGGTRIGEAIRGMIRGENNYETISRETETLLFMASRSHLVRQVILPAIESGECVVSDRFSDSTLAYQGYGRCLNACKIKAMNDFVAGDTVPDITFLLDVDVRAGLERIHKRNMALGAEHDRIEREAIDFHERVRKGYLKLAKREPGRFKVLDGAADEEQVAMQVWDEMQAFMDRMQKKDQ